ncbi:MAG TPA: SDR family oxidoreductase [Candidatus Acidoferrum sp.]|nr:SDR family oxidoreductase [Candidatus Acidoferrum sp.]
MASKQVVMITGASTGFGRLIAETLARHGYIVFATMRDPQGKNANNARELLALAKRESLELFTLELDVTSEASVENAVRAAVGQAGRIDVAVNNAGYGISGLAESVTLAQAQQIMDTNFMGCQRVNRAVLPHMRRQRNGLLMHISSGAGRIVVPAFGFYCASKFAMEALAESYHYELASQGIESVIVQPGTYRTAVFGNMVFAGDTERSKTYGPAKDMPQKIDGVFASVAGDAQELADAILRIVETPAGQKKLRYRVSPNSLGVDEINQVCESVQTRVLEAFRLTTDTAFTQQKATAAD